MVFFNYALRKLNAKIVYYGPGLCGKTTNLQWVHNNFEGGTRGKMISLATEGDRTIFFDLLPLEIGSIRGMEVTLQLYTVPGQVHYNSTRQLVLRGADGVVFVADSQNTMRKSNQESLKNLQENLLLQGIELKEFPHVLQFNKRDLRDLLTIEELDEDLNIFACPFFEATATDGIGVQDTLEGIVKLVMRKLRDRYEPVAAGAPRPAAAPAGPRPMAPSPPEPAPPAQIPPPEPAMPEVPAVMAPPPSPAVDEARFDAPSGVTTEPVAPGEEPPGLDREGFEPSSDLEPEPQVVAYMEPSDEEIDQDNVTTAVFDENGDQGQDFPSFELPGEVSEGDDGPDVLMDEVPAASADDVGEVAAVADRMAEVEAPPEQQIEDLIEQTTDASTIRVEDADDLAQWAAEVRAEVDEEPEEEIAAPPMPAGFVETAPVDSSALDRLDETPWESVEAAAEEPADELFADMTGPEKAIEEPAEEAAAEPPPWEAPAEPEVERDSFSMAKTDTDILFPPDLAEEELIEVPAETDEVAAETEVEEPAPELEIEAELEEPAPEPAVEPAFVGAADEADAFEMPAEMPQLEEPFAAEEEPSEPVVVDEEVRDAPDVFEAPAELEPPAEVHLPVEEPLEQDTEPFAAPFEEPFGEAEADADDRYVDSIRAPSPFARVPTEEPMVEVPPPPEEPEPDHRPPITRAIPVGEALDQTPFDVPEPAEEVPEPMSLADAFPQGPSEVVAEEPDEIPFEEPEEASEAPEPPEPEVAEEPVGEVFGLEVEEPPAAVEAVEMPVADEPPPREDTLVVLTEDDPFADPFTAEEEPPPVEVVEPPAAVVEVVPAPAVAPVDVVQAEGNRLALRLHGTGAIAEAGQVRELDIEVPVPGAWVGNQKVTLQLRLTLVPSQEDEDVHGSG